VVVAICWLSAPKLRDLELADLHEVGKH